VSRVLSPSESSFTRGERMRRSTSIGNSYFVNSSIIVGAQIVGPDLIRPGWSRGRGRAAETRFRGCLRYMQARADPTLAVARIVPSQLTTGASFVDLRLGSLRSPPYATCRREPARLTSNGMDSAPRPWLPSGASPSVGTSSTWLGLMLDCPRRHVGHLQAAETLTLHDMVDRLPRKCQLNLWLRCDQKTETCIPEPFRAL
jgi:hypothetical protein